MLKVVDDASVPNDNTESSGSSLLDEIVRDGARRMLAAARPVVLDLVIEQLGCVDLRAVALSSSGWQRCVQAGGSV